MVESVISNKEIIKQACQMIKIDFLTLKETELAEKFIETAKLINCLITKLQGAKYITISLVLPHLISLQNKIQKITSPGSIFTHNFNKDVNVRLSSVLNPFHPDFNPVYSVVTYLDPNTHKFMFISKKIEC